MHTPIPLLRAHEMRQCDTYTIETLGVPSQTLMERAAHATIEVMRGHADCMPRADREILVLCGSGNNGGDGFAMARFLSEEGYAVTVAYAGAWLADAPDQTRMSVECARQYCLWAAAGGMTTHELPPLGGCVIVDALLGTDLHGAPRPPMDAWIRAINGSGCTVVAVDIPSGVSADNGAVFADGRALISVDERVVPPEVAVRADMTVTMAYPKRGLVFYPGAALAGEMHIVDIGIDCRSISPTTYLLTQEHLAMLPKRPRYANKGTFGRLAVVGGAMGMCGALCFAGRAALRCGVGLCELISDERNAAVLQTLLPEAIFTPLPAGEAAGQALSRADVAVIGCGMGQSATAKDTLAHLLATAACPLVLDADALNIIASDDKGIYRARVRECAKKNFVVMTPHIGEAARLLHADVATLLADLPGAAARLATEYGVICVLKDSRTIISDGQVNYVQSCGNSALSKGGSGDVLAGVIGALLCSNRHEKIAATPTLLVALGVLLHAMAGDRVAEKLGAYAPLARELADAAGEVLGDTK